MKSRITAIYLIILLLGGSFSTAGARTEYVFRGINVSDGLSDSEVRSIDHAPDGLMCVRTSRSLNIYNGATFSQYYYNYEAVPYNENTGVQQDYFDSENRLWLKDSDKLWVFDLDTNEFVYDIAPLLAPYGVELPIKSLFVDREKNFWFVDLDNGLSFYDIGEGRLHPVHTDEPGAEPVEIVQNGEHCWILYDDHILRCWNRRTGRFVYRESAIREQVQGLPYASTPRRMIVTEGGDLWILYSQALYHYDAARREVQKIPDIRLQGSDQLNSMALDADGKLWLASSKSGLRIIDGDTFAVEQLPFLSLVDGSRITHNTDITTLHIDLHGGVWIATLTEGILYYHRSMNKFSLVNNSTQGGGAMPDENIKCIVEDSDGTILLGTVRGLLRYDPADHSVRIAYPELAGELCTGLYRDRAGRIWLGTFANGAFCIDRGRIRHYRDGSMPQVHISYYNSTPNLNNVRTFFEDKQGGFWISVYGGLGRFDPASGDIRLLSERFPQVGRHMVIRNIHYVTDSLLLAASDNGMFLYDPAADAVHTDGEHFPEGIPGTRFNCTMTDSRSLLWMATFDGLFIWDPAARTTRRIDIADGLPNNNIYALEEDAAGDVWLSTFSHLTRIEVGGTEEGYSFALTNFNAYEGVQNGGFFEHSVCRASDGRLYFGGSHGVNVVDPARIVYNDITATPQFIDLRLFNASVERGRRYNGQTILEKPIGQTGRVELKHKQNFISLDFAGLNYVNPAQSYFRYRLDGFESQWTEIVSDNGQGRATYTSLPPGRYTFRVFAANNDRVWGETPAVLSIVISPPFWDTTAARIFYALLFGALIWLSSMLVIRRTKMRQERERERESLRQKEKLDQMKFRFFTNISHELRTPLTLIITPLDTIVKRIEAASPLRDQLGSVRRNAEQLLGLVNQLLDFRKLEMSGETLKLSGNYIARFSEDVFLSFKPLAAEKMINYEFINRLKGDTYLYFDRIKLQKILNNLLGNAFKFTPSGGSITLILDDELFEGSRQGIVLSVSDTGIGIPQEELEHVFDRFYQIDDPGNPFAGGSGIGLHMIREYASLHGGRVEAKSRPGMGSTFTVHIPADLMPEAAEAIERPPLPEQEPEPTDDTVSSGGRKTVLLVEDNDEFRRYVSHELKAHYRVLEAREGHEGIEAACEGHPDLIVSDIMMPGMDGIELCRLLKADIETSHIPVILLTAHQSDENKMEGYEAGADAYIAKPFNFDILLLRIRKLIDQVEKRKQAFSRMIEVNPGQITITSLDEQLLQKALECVEKNIGNPDYSVEELSRDVNMHRMNLYRKLHSLVGQTPSEFIRTIRLKRAAQLLQKSRLPIVEIAEMVGFNTPKYFTRYFKEMFGVTPSQYAAQFKQP